MLVSRRRVQKDVADLSECPALDVIRLLQHTPLDGLPMHSVELTTEALSTADAVVIVTDHSTIDYDFVATHARLVVDTRGVMRGRAGARVIGLSERSAAQITAA